jgi:hypothetical protein
MPVCEIVPHDATVQPVPDILQKIMRLGLELAAGESVAMYVAEFPAFTEGGPATASEKELVTSMLAVPLLDGSAVLMAISETLGGAGRICGAVYVPCEFTVPHDAPMQPLPETIQVTVRLGLVAEFTVATKSCTAPNSTGAV